MGFWNKHPLHPRWSETDCPLGYLLAFKGPSTRLDSTVFLTRHLGVTQTPEQINQNLGPRSISISTITRRPSSRYHDKQHSKVASSSLPEFSCQTVTLSTSDWLQCFQLGVRGDLCAKKQGCQLVFTSQYLCQWDRDWQFSIWRAANDNGIININRAITPPQIIRIFKWTLHLFLSLGYFCIDIIITFRSLF